jgi:hypothetical protein
VRVERYDRQNDMNRQDSIPLRAPYNTMHLKPNADEKTEKWFNRCCLMIIETVMTGFDVGIFPVRNGKFSLSEKKRGCIDVSTSLALSFHAVLASRYNSRDKFNAILNTL